MLLILIFIPCLFISASGALLTWMLKLNSKTGYAVSSVFLFAYPFVINYFYLEDAEASTEVLEWAYRYALLFIHFLIMIPVTLFAQSRWSVFLKKKYPR